MNASRRARVTVLYDGQCRFCKLCIALLLRWDRFHHVYPVAIQSSYGQHLLTSMTSERRLDSAHVVTAEGSLLSGAQAAPALLRELWAGRFLAILVDAAMPLVDRAYGVLTRSRSVVGRMLPASWCAWAERSIMERQRGMTPPTAAR